MFNIKTSLLTYTVCLNCIFYSYEDCPLTSSSSLPFAFHSLPACLTWTASNKLTDWKDLAPLWSCAVKWQQRGLSQVSYYNADLLSCTMPCRAAGAILVGGHAKNTTGTCSHWVNKLGLMGDHGSLLPLHHTNTYRLIHAQALTHTHLLQCLPGERNIIREIGDRLKQWDRLVCSQ